ncbi:MAG: SDR family oxidoreductase [Stellaceae bacterium]|jgi:NAD(P)-dependent dehydrogenase (short-subunit alcohol dehydrogenase family)
MSGGIMTGKTVVITGATSGLGSVAAARLAELGAKLILVARDRAKAEAMAIQLRDKHPGLDADIHIADLFSLGQVRRLAADLLKAAPRIDVLINNAGAIFAKRETTADGLERSFALNHMAYFLLTALLLDRLKASAPARIVNVASEAHRNAALDFGDLQTERNYSGWLAYRRSKLANILFTSELAQRLSGSGVTSNCLHPGFVATSFGDNNGGPFRLAVGLAKRFMAISQQQGGETLVYAASAPEIAGLSGVYFDKNRPREPSAAAQNAEAAARLWNASGQLASL